MISNLQDVPLVKNEFLLRQKYELEGASISEIAAHTFSARSTVLKYLREYGITRRKRDVAHRKGQLAYGEMLKGRRICRNEKELSNIATMKILRDAGHGYSKIAHVLNSQNIPTKNRRGVWKPTTVMKILSKRLPSNHSASGSHSMAQTEPEGLGTP